MSKKEELLQNIKQKFEELTDYTKKYISDNNKILEEIKNAEKNINQLIKDTKIEGSEFNNLKEEEKEKEIKNFLEYYTEIYDEKEEVFEEILNKADNDFQKAEEAIKSSDSLKKKRN